MVDKRTQNIIDQNKVYDLERLKELYPDTDINKDTEFVKWVKAGGSVEGSFLPYFKTEYKLIINE